VGVSLIVAREWRGWEEVLDSSEEDELRWALWRPSIDDPVGGWPGRVLTAKGAVTGGEGRRSEFVLGARARSLDEDEWFRR